MRLYLVTGDTGVVGHRIAEKILLNPECKVLGVSRKHNERTTDLKARFKDRYEHLLFDLSNLEKIEEFFETEIKPKGPVNGFVNNSALAYDVLVSKAEVEKIVSMFTVNMLSPIMVTKCVINNMVENNIGGALVHISSVTAHRGYPMLSMYGCSKGGMEAFSRGIAREWGKKSIRSNCVAPGYMKTDINSNLPEETAKKLYAATALKKETDVDNVAKMVWFLLSDDANSITGEVIRVDCGEF